MEKKIKNKEYFYKYLLFFKKFGEGIRKNTVYNGLNINPAIEIIMYNENKIRDMGGNKVLLLKNIRERDYYNYYSLEESLKTLYKEYEELPFFIKEKIKNFNPSGLLFKDKQVNENLFFYKLFKNELDKQIIEEVFNVYKKNYTQISYSFFKYCFMSDNSVLTDVLFDKKSSSFFNFLVKKKFDSIYDEIEKYRINFIEPFSKFIFHLKNQFYNLHFKDKSKIENLKSFFNLNFLKEYLFVSKTRVNMFFPSLEFYSDTSQSFLLREYYEIGRENINSILFFMYFPHNTVIQLFGEDKIKKDFSLYLKALLNKDKIEKKDIERIFLNLNKSIMKYIVSSSSKRKFKKIMFLENNIQDNTKIKKINISFFYKKCPLEVFKHIEKNKKQKEIFYKPFNAKMYSILFSQYVVKDLTLKYFVKDLTLKYFSRKNKNIVKERNNFIDKK